MKLHLDLPTMFIDANINVLREELMPARRDGERFSVMLCTAGTDGIVTVHNEAELLVSHRMYAGVRTVTVKPATDRDMGAIAYWMRLYAQSRPLRVVD